jgi:hypothetical protein
LTEESGDEYEREEVDDGTLPTSRQKLKNYRLVAAHYRLVATTLHYRPVATETYRPLATQP